MSTVYVICEPVDLGYHMVAGFASHDRAKAELDRMVQQARKEKIIVPKQLFVIDGQRC